MEQWHWSEWIAHDDKGWPEGVEPDEIVLADIDGDIMTPMPACRISWHCPGDPVRRFRRRIWSAPAQAEKTREHSV
jgi:hypothetical protein